MRQELIFDEATKRVVAKKCSTCQEIKPASAFELEPRVNSGLTARCSDCLRAARRKWYAANPEAMAATRAKSKAKHGERWRAIRNQRLRDETTERRVARGLAPLEPRYNGDGKKCTACYRRKPPSEFSHPDHVYCRDCAAAKKRDDDRKQTAEQRRLRRLSRKGYEIKRLYGIDIETAQQILAAQGGKCDICHTSIDLFANRSACVDHCHDSKRVRAVLCVKCNAGLGQFLEDPVRLYAAIDYLRKWAAQ